MRVASGHLTDAHAGSCMACDAGRFPASPHNGYFSLCTASQAQFDRQRIASSSMYMKSSLIAFGEPLNVALARAM